MSIRVELELESGQFTSRLLHAGETVRQFQQNVGDGIRSMRLLGETTQGVLGTLRDLTVTVGMARAAIENIRAVTTGWAADIVKVNAEMEKLGFLLKGMSNAADPVKEARKEVEYLREMAKNTPFALNAITDTFVKMKATGIDPMGGAIKSLTDGVAAFGGTDEVLKRATMAISQMSGKGVIQMEELRQQLGEAMPRATELMARAMGLTTGQLISTISKGTLEAKGALELFFIEVDRTFGGAAQAQMQTFNGQLSQMHTLLQNLALETGKAGFFDAVKKQLGDFNAMLESTIAQRLATSLGSGLTKIVGFIRDAIEWVIRFRSEIALVAEIIAISFGVKLAATGIASFIAGIGGIVTQFRALALAASTAGAGVSAAMTSAAAASGVASTALAGVSVAARGTAIAVGLLGTTIGVMSSVVLPLGIAVAALTVGFGLFSDKTKDAYENLKKFGATSEEEVRNAQAYVDALDKRTAALERHRNMSFWGKMTSEEPSTALTSMMMSDADFAKQRELVRTARERIAPVSEEVARNAAKREVRVEIEKIDEILSANRAGYDKQEKERSKAFDAAFKAATQNNQDTVTLQKQFQQERQAAMIASLQSDIDIYERSLERMAELAEKGDAKAKAVNSLFMQEVLSKQVALIKQKMELEQRSIAPVEITKDVNIERLVERLKAKTDELKSETAGFRAELAGVSGEYAKIAWIIEEAVSKGKNVGPLSNEQIAEQVRLWKEAQKTYDEYERRVTGERKLNQAIESILTKSQAALFEAQTKGKSEFDKILVQLQQGAFNGGTAIERMNKRVADSATDATHSLRMVFGNEMLNGADTYLGIVERIAAQFGVIVNLSDRLPSGAGGAVPAGASRYVSNGRNYFDNLVQQESGGNPYAGVNSTRSTARGIAQFIESTWLDFLKEMHPEMASLSQKEKLDLRVSRNDLNEEAVTWLNKKNAFALDREGIPLNDANMYLAHFLGSGGAIAALTKSSDTLLSSIRALDAARASNPEVFAKAQTVGGLRAWAEQRFGTAFTARTGAGDASNMAALLNSSEVGGADTAKGRALQEAAILNIKKERLQIENALTDAEKEMATAAQRAAENESGRNKNLTATMKIIRDGSAPWVSSRDPNDPVYKNLLDWARKRDEEENLMAERRKYRDSYQSTDERQKRDLEVMEERAAELKRQFESENKFSFSNRYFQMLAQKERVIQQTDKGLAAGSITQEEAQRQRDNEARLVQMQADQEVGTTIRAEQEKIRAIEASLMTVDQAREFNLRNEIRRLEQLRELTLVSGENRAMIEQVIARKIELARRQAMNATPIGQMLKSWTDWGNNLDKGVVSWLDASMDKMAEFVATGKANFSDLAASISKSLASIALKAAFGSVLSNVFGLGGTGKVGGLGKGSAAVATRHGGGFADGFGPYRQVSASLFANAPRFHTGTAGLTLGGDEIPIIAKKGEQVDWPENLARQYGGSNSLIAPTFNVSVQGNPGASAEDHVRMGETIAKAAEHSLRQMIVRELRAQQRPGGIIGKS